MEGSERQVEHSAPWKIGLSGGVEWMFPTISYNIPRESEDNLATKDV